MDLTFIPLEKAHYQKVLPYFQLRSTECCESQFVYHAIWENYYKTRFCLLPSGILWYHKVDHYEHACLLPICKDEDLKEYFNIMQNHFTETLMSKMVMFLVDEEALAIINPSPDRYKIIEDVDSFDYIYDAEKLRLLSGKRYHKKKNHVNGFLKEYQDRYEYKKLDETNMEEILEFTNTWVNVKDSDDEFNRIESEEIGLKNILSCYSFADYRMAGIYIDQKLEAFTLGNYNATHNMAIVHIEKANSQIRGLYPFINQQFLIHEFPDAAFVNREDDMGIASLRKAKESYNPIKMGRKYTIKER